MRFRALDCIRGVCALFVVLAHVEVIGLIDIGHFHGVAFLENCFHLVDFFFVLSGFVISYSCMGRVQTGEDMLAFMIKRFGRVYPLHLVMLVAFILLELVRAWRIAHGLHSSADGGVAQAFTGYTSVESIVPNLLLVQSLHLFPTTTWNTPAWSISVELATYALFAVFALYAKTWRWSSILASLVIAGFGGMIVYLFSPNYMFTMSDYGLFRCIFGFFLGAVAHAVFPVVATWLQGRTLLNTGIEVATTATGILFLCYVGEQPLSLASPLLFFVVVLVFAREAGLVTRWLINRPFEFLGEISYTIYIIHAFSITLLSIAFIYLTNHHALGLSFESAIGIHGLPTTLVRLPSPWLADALAMGVVCVNIVASIYVQRAIENPARRFFNRLAKPRTGPQVRAASDAGAPAGISIAPSGTMANPAGSASTP